MGIIIIFLALAIYGILKIKETFFTEHWTADQSKEHIKNRKWGDKPK